MIVSTPARQTAPRKASAARLAVVVERPAQAPDANLSPTARQLLDVAEKLFAERGIESVSLREIVAASGQRNGSAAQYHFGTREALVGLLIARRVWFINEMRHARLDALEAAGRADDVRTVVSESILVLADAVREQAWGPDYVRIAAQVLLNPAAVFRAVPDDHYWSGHARVSLMLERLLPKLPAQTFHDRMRIVNNETVYSVARWIHAHGPVTPATRERYDALVRHTIEFLAAGMGAPTATPAAKRTTTRAIKTTAAPRRTPAAKARR
jgi:AcrR family transcriptional regulator